MKIIILVIAAALAITATAQKPKRGELPDARHIYYYPFYNGLQLIEVDLLTPAVTTWQFEGSRRSAIVPPPAFANPLIIRNRQGKILHQYNTHAVYKAGDFADPATPATVFPSPQRAAQLLEADASGPVMLRGGALLYKSGTGSRYHRHGYQRQPTTGFYPIDNDGTWYRLRSHRQYESNRRSNSDPLPFKLSPPNRLVVYENGYYGIIDTLGKVVLPTVYDDIDYLPRGLLVTKDRQMGLLNLDGTERIAPRFGLLYPLNDSLLLAGGNRMGVVDYNGWLVLDSVYDELLPTPYFIFYRRTNAADTFAGGYPNRKYGILNRQFQHMTEPRYYGFRSAQIYPERRGCFYVSNGRALGLLDSLGREISPFYFAGEHQQFRFYNGACIAEIKDTAQRAYVTCYALIDSNFRPVGPQRYGYIAAVSDAHYQVKKIYNAAGRGDYDNLALANQKGELLTPFKYQHISHLRNGFFDVTVNNHHGLLNQLGETVLPPVYDYFSFGNSTDTIKACMHPPPPAVKGEKPAPPVCKIFVAKPTGLVELR